MLRNKEVASLKVLWRRQFLEKDTWEQKEEMKDDYPNIFHFDSMST